MTVHLVTFSDESMSRSRELCEQSARANGVFATHVFKHEDCEFRGSKTGVRGLGYWAWKSEIISDVMNPLHNHPYAAVREGDILIYSDAGVEFINNVSHIIDRMDQDIFLFGNNWAHAHWCKRDVVEAIMPGVFDFEHLSGDGPIWDMFGKQVQASVILFRVSDYTRKFVKEWLDWCLFEGGRLIDDSPSRLPNHPEFREHRHDQAILTTLAYREGIKLHYWPAQYNDGAFTYERLPEYAGDDYPILFHHHRRRVHEWSAA